VRIGRSASRVVTDYATFAWLCDVFILKEDRDLGPGKRLARAVVEHEDLRTLRLTILATRGAQELHAGYGDFKPIETPDHWMVRRSPSGHAECALTDHESDRLIRCILSPIPS
jgi:hypothetical protein